MTRRIRTLTIIACAAALGPLTACATEEGLGEAEAPLDGTEVAEDATDDGVTQNEGAREGRGHGKKGPRGHHMRRHRGGPHMLMRAVENLDLSDDQAEQLDALKVKMRTDMQAAREQGPPEARVEMRKALSEAVLAGEVNLADFDDELDAVEARAVEGSKKMLAGLAELRAILTPEQRIQLVADMKAKRAKMAEKRAEMKAKWDDQKAEKRGKRRRGHHMGRLDLSDAQQAELEKARTAAGLDERPAKPDEGSMAAVMDAFASNSFDVDGLAAESPMPKMARAMAERKLKELSVLVPILDDAQRTSLSGKVAEGLKHHGRRGKKGRRGGEGRRGRR